MQRARGWAAQQKPDIVWATRREGITQKQTDFHSSKCLREQPAQANEASPQVVQLQMGSEHRNCQEMGSSTCLRSGDCQPGCAQTPKPFLVTPSSPLPASRGRARRAERQEAGARCCELPVLCSSSSCPQMSWCLLAAQDETCQQPGLSRYIPGAAFQGTPLSFRGTHPAAANPHHYRFAC